MKGGRSTQPKGGQSRDAIRGGPSDEYKTGPKGSGSRRTFPERGRSSHRDQSHGKSRSNTPRRDGGSKGGQRSQSCVPPSVRKKQNSGNATQIDATRDLLAIANAAQFEMVAPAVHVNWLNAQRNEKPSFRDTAWNGGEGKMRQSLKRVINEGITQAVAFIEGNPEDDAVKAVVECISVACGGSVPPLHLIKIDQIVFDPVLKTKNQGLAIPYIPMIEDIEITEGYDATPEAIGAALVQLMLFAATTMEKIEYSIKGLLDENYQSGVFAMGHFFVNRDSVKSHSGAAVMDEEKAEMLRRAQVPRIRYKLGPIGQTAAIVSAMSMIIQLRQWYTAHGLPELAIVTPDSTISSLKCLPGFAITRGSGSGAGSNAVSMLHIAMDLDLITDEDGKQHFYLLHDFIPTVKIPDPMGTRQVLPCVMKTSFEYPHGYKPSCYSCRDRPFNTLIDEEELQKMTDDESMLTVCGPIKDKGFVCRLGLGRSNHDHGKCSICFQMFTNSVVKHAYEECPVIKAVTKDHPTFLPVELITIKSHSIEGKLQLGKRLANRTRKFNTPLVSYQQLKQAQEERSHAQPNQKKARVVRDSKVQSHPRSAAMEHILKLEAAVAQSEILALEPAESNEEQRLVEQPVPLAEAEPVIQSVTSETVTIPDLDERIESMRGRGLFTAPNSGSSPAVTRNAKATERAGEEKLLADAEADLLKQLEEIRAKKKDLGTPPSDTGLG